MGIKNLEQRMRLPRLGVIRLGVKQLKRGGKTENANDWIPAEVSYFVCPPELAQSLGQEKPTTITCLLPSDDIDAVLPCRYEVYAGKRLTLACDGRRCVELPPKGDEVVSDCKRPDPTDSDPKPDCECKAKAKGRLNIIPLAGGIGTYQVVLGGEQRIADLLMELRQFKAVFGSLTQINGHPIPFQLERVPAEAQILNAQKERIARTGWPVHLRCNFTVTEALASRGLALAAAGGHAALGPGPAPEHRPPEQASLPLAAPVGHEPAEEGDDTAPLDEDGVMGPQTDEERAVNDLWTLYFDAAQGHTAAAMAAFRADAKRFLGRAEPRLSLADLKKEELQRLAISKRPADGE